MSDLIYDFAVGGAAFSTENLLTKRVVAQFDLTSEEGFFFDLMGDGFVFGESPTHGLIALVGDPVLMCSTSTAPAERGARRSSDELRLAHNNMGRSPHCKTIVGDDLRDVVIRFAGEQHQNKQFDDLAPDQLEQDQRVYWYEPAGANWRLSVNADGRVVTLEVFDYLARFWDERRSHLVATPARPDDYSNFARCMHLLADLEAVELDADEIAHSLREFRQTALADVADSPRLQILGNTIDVYVDDHLG